jgi:hypothetical protein
MDTYRLYFIGGDGDFAKAVEFDAVSHEQAIQNVVAYVDGRDMELWRRDRKIRAFPGDPTRSPSRVGDADDRPPLTLGASASSIGCAAVSLAR